MRAITIPQPGGPEILEWTELPDPEPGPGEVLIDVAAAGVNRADLMQREGNYPPPPGASPLLGLECSGTIAALGSGVTSWNVGDRVCALLAGGGYAEKVVVAAEQVLPVPSGVDLEDAAALPEVACTVVSTVVMQAGLSAGQLLLVHGGSGGVGTFAIQLARALDARVIATAGSPESQELCRQLGAEEVISYRDGDFVAATKRLGGAQVILDNMGPSYLDRNLSALAPDGQLIVIGLQSGRMAELDLGKMLVKRLRLSTPSLRGRPVHGADGTAELGKAAIVAETQRLAWPLVEEGLIRPVIQQRLPLREARQAHELLEAGGVGGKLLLTRGQSG